ncbi:hypothetical protein RPALISO_58 [Ruegeria phage RpAliso]|nr:hypothetical protein RPALISO_58 [Ruegeria phage RpAliso]
MMSVVANASQFISGLERSEKAFEGMFRERVRKLVTEGMRRLIAKTPVWTGQAVASYVASAGAPKQANKPQGVPVEATNKLALGSERLRGSAAAQAMATIATVDFRDPFQTFYITNDAPHIAGLERGELPGDPFTPRSPAGMFGVTVQELMLHLNTGKI